MTETLAVLGSTGSIGVRTLDVARALGIKIEALSGNVRADVLEKQIREFKPRAAALADEKAAAELKIAVADLPTVILSGEKGVEECARIGADVVLNGVVGIAGLAPTLAAIDVGSKIALANKETLVAGGKIVIEAAEKKKVPILPVDSEHSAIFQSLQGCADKKQAKKLILTASGGPFFGKTRAELENVTPERALDHPKWRMGAKITVDSATMMNKGLEIIEAALLFDMKIENIDVLVHRQSVVHSLVEFADGSIIAQLGAPDMRAPIQYALTYPDRIPGPAASLDLAKEGTLTFEKPDYETFPCMNLCRRAFEKGGLFPAAVNAANEKANELFRKGKIRFLDIQRAVEAAFNFAPEDSELSLEGIFETDRRARRETERLFL